ncbi:hypothetical protein [Hydrogenophaga sp.]|uniref:hypothetical protein n=1 Tax=Hydrogenophaga sp. TaxID=1904254 RepID=UPI002FC666D1
MTEKKLSALECASVEEAAGHSTQKDPPGSEPAPCVLLDPRAPVPAQEHSIDPGAGHGNTPRREVEDEAADPVGDGHSDADLAADLPPRDPPSQPRKGSSQG